MCMYTCIYVLYVCIFVCSYVWAIVNAAAIFDVLMYATSMTSSRQMTNWRELDCRQAAATLLTLGRRLHQRPLPCYQVAAVCFHSGR